MELKDHITIEELRSSISKVKPGDKFVYVLTGARFVQNPESYVHYSKNIEYTVIYNNRHVVFFHCDSFEPKDENDSHILNQLLTSENRINLPLTITPTPGKIINSLGRMNQHCLLPKLSDSTDTLNLKPKLKTIIKKISSRFKGSVEGLIAKDILKKFKYQHSMILDNLSVELYSYINSEGKYDFFLGALKRDKYNKFISNVDFNNDVNAAYRKCFEIVKVGRFFGEFTGASGRDLELFVSAFSGIFHEDSNKIELVSGTDIMKYYLEANYAPKGKANSTLHNSCMKYAEKQDKIRFYSIQDKCKMYVILDCKDKVLARALLWETNKGLFLDRIYAIDDVLGKLLESFVYSKGVVYSYNKRDNGLISEDLYGMYIDITLPEALEDYDIPYMDSFNKMTPTLNRLYHNYTENDSIRFLGFSHNDIIGFHKYIRNNKFSIDRSLFVKLLNNNLKLKNHIIDSITNIDLGRMGVSIANGVAIYDKEKDYYYTPHHAVPETVEEDNDLGF